MLHLLLLYKGILMSNTRSQSHFLASSFTPWTRVKYPKTLFWGREPTSTSRVRKPAPVECQERTQGWPSCDYFNLAKEISGHIVGRKERCFLFRVQGWESCPSQMPRATAINLQGRKGGSAAGPHVMSSTKMWKHSKSTCAVRSPIPVEHQEQQHSKLRVRKKSFAGLHVAVSISWWK